MATRRSGATWPFLSPDRAGPARPANSAALEARNQGSQAVATAGAGRADPEIISVSACSLWDRRTSSGNGRHPEAAIFQRSPAVVRVMENLTHYPPLVLAAAFVALWLASLTGSWLRKRYSSAGDEQNEDIGVILAATLTLLALIIGFSFSMATNRYD